MIAYYYLRAVVYLYFMFVRTYKLLDSGIYQCCGDMRTTDVQNVHVKRDEGVKCYHKYMDSEVLEQNYKITC